MGIVKMHGENIHIDDEMEPVIKELNKLGLKTISSCSGHPEKNEKRKAMAQITFDAKNCVVLLQNNCISINWKRDNCSPHYTSIYCGGKRCFKIR